MRTDLVKFNNDWFAAEIGASKFKQILWYFCNILFFKNPFNVSSKLKVFFLRLFGANVGVGVVLKPSISIKYPWKIIIGDSCWIGENVWIDNLAIVLFGNNVCVSQGAMLLTGNHNYKKTSFDLIVGDITLGDGVWIGAKSLVCPGVVCGSHSVLTAGSVATKDLAAYTIYQGNPALPIRERVIIE